MRYADKRVQDSDHKESESQGSAAFRRAGQRPGRKMNPCIDCHGRMVSLAGGCLLTDPIFSERLKKLLEWHGALLADDIRLIKIGREIFDQNGIIVVGRDEKDNEKIRKNSVPSDITTTTAEVKGPLTVVRMKGVNERKTGKPEDRGKAVPDHHLLKKAAHLSIRYSRARLAEEASD